MVDNLVATSGMRSGLANCTPVLGFVLPRPPTPPSNALDGSAAVLVKRRARGERQKVDLRRLLNCLRDWNWRLLLRVGIHLLSCVCVCFCVCFCFGWLVLLILILMLLHVVVGLWIWNPLAVMDAKATTTTCTARTSFIILLSLRGFIVM